MLAGATPHAAMSAPPLSKDLPAQAQPLHTHMCELHTHMREPARLVSVGTAFGGRLPEAVPWADMQLLRSPCH